MDFWLQAQLDLGVVCYPNMPLPPGSASLRQHQPSWWQLILAGPVSVPSFRFLEKRGSKFHGHVGKSLV